MKKYLCLIGVLGVLLCNTANSYAQKVAVKTNLLYDATTTMNLGLEIGLNILRLPVAARQPLESGGCAWSRLCAAGPLQISLCHMRHRSEK